MRGRESGTHLWNGILVWGSLCPALSTPSECSPLHESGTGLAAVCAALGRATLYPVGPRRRPDHHPTCVGQCEAGRAGPIFGTAFLYGARYVQRYLLRANAVRCTKAGPASLLSARRSAAPPCIRSALEGGLTTIPRAWANARPGERDPSLERHSCMGLAMSSVIYSERMQSAARKRDRPRCCLRGARPRHLVSGRPSKEA